MQLLISFLSHFSTEMGEFKVAPFKRYKSVLGNEKKKSSSSPLLYHYGSSNLFLICLMTYGHSVLPSAFILIFMLILLRSDSTSSINLSLGHPYFYLPPGVSSSNHFAVLSPSTLTCQSHSNLHTSFTVTKVRDLNLLHVVASKCSRNSFMSVKFKTIQSFKLYFHQL